jgi:hypothetical protein
MSFVSKKNINFVFKVLTIMVMASLLMVGTISMVILITNFLINKFILQ